MFSLCSRIIKSSQHWSENETVLVAEAPGELQLQELGFCSLSIPLPSLNSPRKTVSFKNRPVIAYT